MKEFIGLKISTEKKERDTWAIQVMNELVQCASSYKCKGRDADIDCSKARSDRDGGENLRYTSSGHPWLGF